MLGGEPILTRDGGTLTDGHGHHPYVTSAGSAPSLGKHVLLAYLPPEEARDRQRARGLLHGGALPGDGRLRRRHRAVRPEQRADAVMTERPRLREAGAGLLRRGAADRGRAVGRRTLRGLHDEQPRRSAPSSSPCRSPRRPTGTVDRADGRLGRLRRAAALRPRRRRHGRGPGRGRPGDAGSGRRRPRDRAGGPRPRGSDVVRLVLLGNDAADSGDFQVGIRLGHELVAAGRDRRADARRGRRHRALPAPTDPTATETYAVPLPAVVTRDGGRRRAALPHDHRPDEGQEGRGRDPRARPASRVGQRPGEADPAADRRPPAPRCSARARRPRRSWSTCCEKLGVTR